MKIKKLLIHLFVFIIFIAGSFFISSLLQVDVSVIFTLFVGIIYFIAFELGVLLIKML